MVKVVLVHPIWRVKDSEIKDPNSRHVDHLRTDVLPDTSGNPRVRNMTRRYCRTLRHIVLPIFDLYFTPGPINYADEEGDQRAISNILKFKIRRWEDEMVVDVGRGEYQPFTYMARVGTIPA